MNSTQLFLRSAVLGLILSGSLAQAASITGTVTNKTTGKPSAGDTVVLIEVQTGMTEAARATTDARGHYSLDSAGSGPALIRADHQGGSYFIAAPSSGSPGDITVYDVAAKVDGVSIDAEMILAEGGGGMLRVQERYMVRNTSLPPKAQFSDKTFEFVIPSDAVLESASATRPGGMATNAKPIPLGQKGHYTINVPIQPNKAEKETLFEVQYQISYKGKFTFTPQPQMPADNLVVYLPKGMTFSAASGSTFQSEQQDPRVQTFVTKNVHPGQTVAFTVSGEGQMPRDAQGAPGQQAEGGMADTGPNAKPGGGIGVPIDTPDPLSKYKWWILAGLALLLAAAVAFFLRKQRGIAGSEPVAVNDTFEARPSPTFASSTAPAASYSPPPKAGNAVLLNALKEEMFSIESEKISGTISPVEYAEVKAGLEAVLKRALKRSS
jgi:hypothetical protein